MKLALRNTNHLKVSLVARRQPAGLFENGQFRRLAKDFGDDSVRAGIEAIGETFEPAKSAQRLTLLLDEKFDFAAPVVEGGDGHQQFRIKTKENGGTKDISDPRTGQPIRGELFVASLGSPGQLPPEIAALALESRRLDPEGDTRAPSQRPVSIKADFTVDGRYIGYTVLIRIQGVSHAFAVRGAATRFVPTAEFVRMGRKGQADLDRIEKSSPADRPVDAPSSGGNFDGGFASTANQTNRQHDRRELDDGD